MRTLLLLVLGSALVVGCAVRPESIAPAYVSERAYKDWTCDELAQERMRLASALSRACDAQRQARDNDAVGFILIGFPVSSLSGTNMAAEIARLKGEMQALEKMAVMKGCHLPEIPDPVR